MRTDAPSSNRRGTMLEVRNEILVALLNEFRELDEAEDPEGPALYVDMIADHNGIDASKAVLRLCIKGLLDDGLITTDDTFDLSDSNFFCHLTAKGFMRAEEIEARSSTEGARQAGDENNDTTDSSIATNQDTAPQASTTPSSETFGFSSDSAPFGSGTFAERQPAPAADRYVSVKDNQPAFEELEDALTLIKNEFAADHNKRELPIDNLEARQAEIEAFELTIERGWVSSKSAKNLLETLRYIKEVCIEFQKICTAAAIAIGAIITIIGML